jgi:hypothetical protein
MVEMRVVVMIAVMFMIVGDGGDDWFCYYCCKQHEGERERWVGMGDWAGRGRCGVAVVMGL